jgi:hypothetical protein
MAMFHLCNICDTVLFNMSSWSERNMISMRTVCFHDLNYPPTIITVTNSNRMERQDGKNAWEKMFTEF